MQGPFVAGYSAVAGPFQESYGLQRLDHSVGNVHVMHEAVSYIQAMTGFHHFAEFTTAEVGTVDSGVPREEGVGELSGMKAHCPRDTPRWGRSRGYFWGCHDPEIV